MLVEGSIELSGANQFAKKEINTNIETGIVKISISDFPKYMPRKKIFKQLSVLGYIKSDDDKQGIIRIKEGTDIPKYYSNNLDVILAGIVDADTKELISNYHQEILTIINRIKQNLTTKLVRESKDAYSLEYGSLDLKGSSIKKLTMINGTLSTIEGSEIDEITIVGGRVIVKENEALRGKKAKIESGILIFEKETNNQLSTSMMSFSGNINHNQSPCTAKYHVLMFETLIGRFDDIDTPEPSPGCDWDLSQMYTQGIIAEEEIAYSQLLATQQSSELRSSQIIQGKPFKVGFRYFDKNDENIDFTIHIFDMLGHLHLQKSFKNQRTEYNDYYSYYLVDIHPSEFIRMPVGVYLMTLSYNGQLQSKAKVSVHPASKGGVD